MKKVIMAVITIFMAMLVATSVYAQDAKSYVDLKLGAFYPNQKEDGLKDFDIGPNIEADLGYKFNKNLAGEIGIGYIRTTAEFIYDPTTGEKEEDTASAIPITLTAKGILPLAGDKVELFAGAGLGYYFTKVEAEYVYPPNPVFNDSVSKSKGAFGYHVVGGADYNITKTIALGFEVKWFSVKPDYGTVVSAGGSSLDIGKVEGGGVITNLALKYRF
ncbi:MAG: porin family protein [Nitrospirae bacterium]|nr:porin family protein [Nitrospirota bacterium]